NHPATIEAKEIFRPAYRLYSGAFVDVVYDYFLANDKNEFTASSLYLFSQEVYKTLAGYSEILPPFFAGMFPYMQSQNWLYNYRTEQGIIKSFGGLVRRAKYLEESETAAKLFQANITRFKRCYDLFWKDIKVFAESNFLRLLEE